MKIRKVSQLTGEFHSREIVMTENQLERIRKGDELIQVIMHNTSTDDREFLISGITPEEWDKVFPEEE